MENPRDEKLWKLAEERAKFKRHAANYVAVNIFLWAIWCFQYFKSSHEDDGLNLWPLWVSLGWGFGLLMHYFRVYHTNMEQDTENEYKKLKNDGI